MTAQPTAKRASKRAKKPAATVADAVQLAADLPASSAPVAVAVAVAVAVPVASAAPALPSTLTLRQVAEVADLLLSAVAEGTNAIDASAVLQCDTAGLQLLIAAANSAAARGGKLVLEGASSALRDGATRLGVAGTLGLEEAA